MTGTPTPEPSEIQAAYASGAMRPTGEWVTCAAESCDASAAHDVCHSTDDGQVQYVPLCIPHIWTLGTPEAPEYLMEVHGFFRKDAVPEPESDVCPTCGQSPDALREAEAYAKEGWDWLSTALDALGVETVFDIPVSRNE